METGSARYSDAGEIDPEVAQRVGAAMGETAHNGGCQRDTHRTRGKLVEDQTNHLREVAHGCLATIVLPVGVGRKADSGIPGQPWLNPLKSLRVERQDTLKPLDQVEQ